MSLISYYWWLSVLNLLLVDRLCKLKTRSSRSFSVTGVDNRNTFVCWDRSYLISDRPI